MSRNQFAVVVFVVLTVLCPRDAAAEGGVWEYLERLSGPGAFYGFVLDAPIGCRVKAVAPGPAAKVRATAEFIAKVPRETVYGEKCWNRRLLPNRLREAGSRDGYAWNRTWSVGLSLGWLGTKDNNLDYDVPSKAVPVRWLKFGPRVTLHASRYVDFHASVDFNRLSSRDVTANNFDNIWFATVEPAGITVRPFARSNSLWRHIGVGVRPQFLTRSLNASMFGATPRKLESAGHLHWQAGIRIDPWKY